MKNPIKIKKLIENWLSIHEDNTVRIEGHSDNTILARNDIDCNGKLIKIEYIEFEIFRCECCGDSRHTYYNFNEIDFKNCVLSFENAKGIEIKKINCKN